MELTRSKGASDRGKTVTPVDPTQLVQLSTSFDYLNGAFGRAERGRKTTALIALAGTAAAALLCVLGLQGNLDAHRDREALAATERTNRDTLAELAELDQAGGIPASTLRQQTAARFKVYKAAVAGEVDVQGLLRAAAGSAPVGVDVTALAVVQPEVADPAGAQPAPATTPAAGAATPATKTVTITGTASSFSKIGEWQEQLSRVPGLSGIEPSWTGGGAELTVTVTATLEKGSWTRRALDAEAADANGLPRSSVTPPRVGQ